MKKLLFLLILFFLIIFTTNIAHKSLEKSETESVKELEENNIESRDTNQYLDSKIIKDTRYAYRVISADEANKISINSNLETKLPTEEIITKENCKNLVSAGFYNQDNKHIGLFISEYRLFSESSNNSVFNGYFYIKDGEARISRKVPKFPKYAVQSGPLLVENGTFLEIDVKDDKNARRIVVVVTETSELIFVIIYDKDLLFQGPFLNELSDILINLEQTLDIKINDALNLDGGTHSAFYTDSIEIKELSPIGGYFCIN